MLDHHKVDPIINAPLNVHFLIIGLLLQPSPHGIGHMPPFPTHKTLRAVGLVEVSKGTKSKRLFEWLTDY